MKVMEMRILGVILPILLAGNVSYAKSLYVNANTGSDSTTYANNTINSPWRTIGRAAWGSTVRTSPVAAEAAQAGDTVFIAAGTYDLGNATASRFEPTLNPANEGRQGSPITFKGQGEVILRHTGLASDGTGSPTIGSNGRDYITWDGFHIIETNAQPHADTGPVVVNGNGTTCGARGVILKNLIIDGMTVDYGYGDNHNGIRLENACETTIQNSKINGVRIAQGTTHNSAGIMMYYSNDTTIENNEIYSNDCGIYAKGGDNQNVCVRYNLLWGNYKGLRIGFTVSGSVYQNIIRDSTNYGINIAGGAKNISIYNNTLDNNASGIGFSGDADDYGVTNHVIRNNIITTSTEAIGAGDIGSLADVTINYNHYYNFTRFTVHGNIFSTIASWRTETGKEANSATSNPQYVNSGGDNFHLSPGSPALRSSDTGGPVGAYLTGNEVIGIIGSDNPPPNHSLLPSPPSITMIN